MIQQNDLSQVRLNKSFAIWTIIITVIIVSVIVGVGVYWYQKSVTEKEKEVQSIKEEFQQQITSLQNEIKILREESKSIQDRISALETEKSTKERAAIVTIPKEESASAKKDTTFWYTYDEGLAKAKEEQKYVMVHFYTTWCGWCKRMDKLTFDNEEIRKILSSYFVAIKVNAESADKVKVEGKDMTLRQLAGEYNARAYPDTWFLKPTGERIGERKGYVEADEFQYILKWVKDDQYDKVSFAEYVKQQQEKGDTPKK